MKHDVKLIDLLKRYPYYKKLHEIVCAEIERRRSALREPVKLPPDMFNLTIEKFERPILRGKQRRTASLKETVYTELEVKSDFNYGYSPIAAIQTLIEKRRQLAARISQIDSAMEILTAEQKSIIFDSVIDVSSTLSVEEIAEKHYMDRSTLYRQRDEALKRLGYVLRPCLGQQDFSINL